MELKWITRTCVELRRSSVLISENIAIIIPCEAFIVEWIPWTDLHDHQEDDIGSAKIEMFPRVRTQPFYFYWQEEKPWQAMATCYRNLRVEFTSTQHWNLTLSHFTPTQSSYPSFLIEFYKMLLDALKQLGSQSVQVYYTINFYREIPIDCWNVRWSVSRLAGSWSGTFPEKRATWQEVWHWKWKVPGFKGSGACSKVSIPTAVSDKLFQLHHQQKYSRYCFFLSIVFGFLLSFFLKAN